MPFTVHLSIVFNDAWTFSGSLLRPQNLLVLEGALQLLMSIEYWQLQKLRETRTGDIDFDHLNTGTSLAFSFFGI